MGQKRVTKLQERLLECNFGEAWQNVTQAGRTMYPHLGDIVWETFIRHKKQMDKTLAFNEITPLPYCFKVLQTCFGLPEFDTEKGQSSSFVPEPPANFWTTGYIGLSVRKFFFRLIIVGSNLFCLIMIGIHLLKLLYNPVLKRT